MVGWCYKYACILFKFHDVVQVLRPVMVYAGPHFCNPLDYYYTLGMHMCICESLLDRCLVEQSCFSEPIE